MFLWFRAKIMALSSPTTAYRILSSMRSMRRSSTGNVPAMSTHITSKVKCSQPELSITGGQGIAKGGTNRALASDRKDNGFGMKIPTLGTLSPHIADWQSPHEGLRVPNRQKGGDSTNTEYQPIRTAPWTKQKKINSMARKPPICIHASSADTSDTRPKYRSVRCMPPTNTGLFSAESNIETPLFR